MRKEIILIEDCYKGGVETVEYFGDDLDKAIKEAKYRWDRLTEKEKKDCLNFHVSTATVAIDEDTDEKYYDEIVKTHWDFKKYYIESNVNMLKLIREHGNLKGHIDISLVEIEEFGLVALNGWNGEVYFDCYQCDGVGALDGDDGIILRPVQEPISFDEDGEPDQWETIGYIQENCNGIR